MTCVKRFINTCPGDQGRGPWMEGRIHAYFHFQPKNCTFWGCSRPEGEALVAPGYLARLQAGLKGVHAKWFWQHSAFALGLPDLTGAWSATGHQWPRCLQGVEHQHRDPIAACPGSGDSHAHWILGGLWRGPLSDLPKAGPGWLGVSLWLGVSPHPRDVAAEISSPLSCSSWVILYQFNLRLVSICLLCPLWFPRTLAALGLSLGES